ncbi:MAG TPA: ATP-dependent Clp protease proteolytic subunit [Chloroflexia bacterium]|nr:ATP-dependent Clp protease proteolytic subunit [Chloroflexia bacterium]
MYRPPDSRLMVPYVIEATSRGERTYDIYSRLLRDRIVFIGTPIDEELANAVVAQLLFLDYEDPEREVNLYINSPGGSVTAGLAIYDTMQFIRPPVATMAVGQTASMATVILCAGTAGMRRTLPNARMHMHPASVGKMGGYAPDIQIHARELLRTQERVREILARHTGQTLATIARDSDRDIFMDAERAVAYGLVDEIMPVMPREGRDVRAADNGHRNGTGDLR